MLRVFILTIFPEIVKNFLNLSIIKRAIKKGVLSVEVVNIREFSKDKHKKVDDYIYGNKKGMLFSFKPLYFALEYIKSKSKSSYVILPSPRGRILDNFLINDLSKLKEITFICPNYEGVDERILRFINEEISIGDYIISSGELAVFVILESILRKKTIKYDSYSNDSFSLFKLPFLLENPQYTRPSKIINPLNRNIYLNVPNYLTHGNHKEILKNNLKSSISQTIYKKPSLFLKLYNYLSLKKNGRRVIYTKNFFNFISNKELDDILYEAILDNVIPS